MHWVCNDPHAQADQTLVQETMSMADQEAVHFILSSMWHAACNCELHAVVQLPKGLGELFTRPSQRLFQLQSLRKQSQLHLD